MGSQKYIEQLEKENAKLKEKNLDLQLTLNDFSESLTNAIEQIDKLEKLVKKKQDKIIKSLQGKFNKDSSNSDLPPSKDLYRKNRRVSNRIKSGKKPGGQKGHKGFTLEFSDNPDEHINIYPLVCDDCGRSLNGENALLHASRQVIDLPKIQPKTTQFNTFKEACICGHITKAQFPYDVNAHVQYGNNVRALINYFSIWQLIPFKRLTDLFKDVFCLPFSQGTITNTIQRSAKQADYVYNEILNHIKQAKVIGADETTIFVNAKKNTLWVWQNSKFTFLKVTKTRQQEHIYSSFENGFPNAVLVSDQYKPHINTPAIAHQICWPHIFRKIKGLLQIQESTWLEKLRHTIDQAYQLFYEKEYFKTKTKRTKLIEKTLDDLLEQKLDENVHPKILTLQNSLKRDRAHLLTFLYFKGVPPDNNASEKAIRNAKVKTKISGGFKALQNPYAILRSIIDSSTKNQVNVLYTLLRMEQGYVPDFI